MTGPAVDSILAAGRPVVVFDLEFTAWEGSMARRWRGPGEHREVVQVGAVRVDPAAGFRELDRFEVLVRPHRNPTLSAYLIALTGIDQAAVDRDGLDFPEAMERFGAFCATAGAVLSNGPDVEVLRENFALLGLEPQLPAAPFLNVGPLLAAAAGVERHVSSGTLWQHFPTVPHLPAHNALADARMVAAALGAVVRSTGVASGSVAAGRRLGP